MNIIGYIPEILINICNNLYITDFKKVNILSQKHHQIIRNEKWPSKVIKLRKVTENKTLIFLNNYNFCDYIISCEIKDEGVKALHKCHTLNLSYCKLITDEGVKALHKCHTLNLSYCGLITDEAVKALHKCNTLNLSYYRLITDGGVKALHKCHTLNLSYCRLITDEAVKALHKCHTLNLSNCKLILMKV